eukprot:CAMPEP_0197857070 /NCGR_PEP_ID=MMETSP1438-20131217/29800_1 /TAXON_ID=1461541 /ORGANISM="Pterosperma sp., Strain CCMP1384" /LENGTH=197 /DNA_ID=CAMNT_0043472763 /DNA_START=442 /DNA_END=1035 /DNA_ORIENTATION=+
MSASILGPLRNSEEQAQASPFAAAPIVETSQDDAFLSKPKTAYAKGRNIHISPRKLRMVAPLVTGLTVPDAMIQCEMSPKKACRIAARIINAARANAIHNFGMKKENLVIHSIRVSNGFMKYHKRIDIRARGKTGMKKKYRAHCRVTVEEVADPKHYADGRKRRSIKVIQDTGPKDKRNEVVPAPPKYWVQPNWVRV